MPPSYIAWRAGASLVTPSPARTGVAAAARSGVAADTSAAAPVAPSPARKARREEMAEESLVFSVTWLLVSRHPVQDSGDGDTDCPRSLSTMTPPGCLRTPARRLVTRC